jgi:hypothetical protein
MFVQIETKNKNLAYEIMEKEIKKGVSLSIGESLSLKNMKITYRSKIFRKLEVYPILINLSITFETGVTASFVGDWLYNKIHGKAGKLIIDYEEIDIDESVIIKTVEMKIKKKLVLL